MPIEGFSDDLLPLPGEVPPILPDMVASGSSDKVEGTQQSARDLRNLETTSNTTQPILRGEHQKVAVLADPTVRSGSIVLYSTIVLLVAVALFFGAVSLKLENTISKMKSGDVGTEVPVVAPPVPAVVRAIATDADIEVDGTSSRDDDYWKTWTCIGRITNTGKCDAPNVDVTAQLANIYWLDENGQPSDDAVTVPVGAMKNLRAGESRSFAYAVRGRVVSVRHSGTGIASGLTLSTRVLGQ